ncbi:hypothetical protein [uncultured Sulfitobacter sp.]|uniref:hypothetical protein n=1 Tax=uncultured Sulfitobacter sp. TaxID=191468 RepID=UPI00261E93CC|nr:hypothetical protein [uncultured Sulfitobacter sp.]
MASDISGKFTLNVGEILCGGDDRAPDVLEWDRVSSMRNEPHKMKENKMLRVLIMLLSIGQVAQAEDATENLATGEVQQDEYGCTIVERPDELTFLTFRDAWRSIAADKLYSLHRHEAAITAESCDCAALRPEWATIMGDFEALGFVSGPSSTYRDWAAASYFPVISDLRKSVQELCEEPN